MDEKIQREGYFSRRNRPFEPDSTLVLRHSSKKKKKKKEGLVLAAKGTFFNLG